MLVASASTAGAAELEVPGWWRARWLRIDGAPAAVDGGRGHTELLDQRASLFPRLDVTPRVALRARVDVLSDVLFGNNAGEPSILAGLGDATSATGRDLEPVDDVRIARLWADLRTRFGILRLGRTPSRWGLGIVAADGDRLEWGPEGNGPDRGDTVDRVAYGTDLGPLLLGDRRHLYTAIAYDRITEDVAGTRADLDAVTGLALLTERPPEATEPGARELGLYVTASPGGSRASVQLVDLYLRLEGEPAPGWRLWVEGEGAVAWGRARRATLLPAGAREAFVGSVRDELATVLPAALAESVAREGSALPPLQDLVAEGLLEAGFREEIARLAAREGAGAGFDRAAEDFLDLRSGLGLLRAGVEHDGISLALEWGWAGGGEAGRDAIPALVGPIAARPAEAADAISRAQLGRALTTLTGDRIGTLAFDREHDPALILYEELGPLRLSDGTPAVQNTTYLSATLQWRASDALRVWTRVLWGRLLEPVGPLAIEGDADGRAVVVDERDARELGVELDAGIDLALGANLRAELKAGWLATGAAFGSRVGDVLLVRPQIAVSF